MVVSALCIAVPTGLAFLLCAASAHLYHIDPITVCVANMSVKRPVLLASFVLGRFVIVVLFLRSVGSVHLERTPIRAQQLH